MDYSAIRLMCDTLFRMNIVWAALMLFILGILFVVVMVSANSKSETKTEIEPPGQIIKELVKFRGVEDVHNFLGLTENELGLLYEGKYPITQDLARKLEQHFGWPWQFWYHREEKWQKTRGNKT